MAQLEEAGYGLTEHAHLGASGRFKDDDNLYVKFYMHPKRNQTKSRELGRPIFDDVPYVSIMQPGNKESMIMRPATDMDKSRFSSHFKKFTDRNNEDYDGISGMPLIEWPGVTRSQAEELKFFNVMTVEHLANMTDGNASKFMGIQALRIKAQKYLEVSGIEAAAEKLTETEDRLVALEARLEEMAVENSTLKALVNTDEE